MDIFNPFRFGYNSIGLLQDFLKDKGYLSKSSISGRWSSDVIKGETKLQRPARTLFFLQLSANFSTIKAHESRSLAILMKNTILNQVKMIISIIINQLSRSLGIQNKHRSPAAADRRRPTRKTPRWTHEQQYFTRARAVFRKEKQAQTALERKF